MIIDSYLAMRGIAPIEMGRALGLKWPAGARRYLQLLKCGKPNLHYRVPDRKIQLKIQRWSRGAVTPNDWPDKPPAAEQHQLEIYDRCQTKRAIKRASLSAKLAQSS